MNITKKLFGTTPDGVEAQLFTLTNDNGVEATITNYSGTITSIKVPDRKGDIGDVVLGYDTLAEYIKNSRFLGCLVGRYANRIAQGRFSLDGKTYQLARNNGANHLHGGIRGFDKVVWDACVRTDDSAGKCCVSQAGNRFSFFGSVGLLIKY